MTHPKSLIDHLITRARAVLFLLVFLLILGMVAYSAIPRESSPDVQIPIIYVAVTLEGVSPEDAERLILRPLEKHLKSVENVKRMTSESTEGFGSVTLEFQAGFDSDAALADVRARVDEAKPELPVDAEEPSVNEVNLSQFPILNVIVTGKADERTLSRTARRLRDKLEGLSPVLEVRIDGEREELLEVRISPQTMETYRINPAEVLQKVDRNNILIAAGELDSPAGRFRINVPGLIETYDDLRSIPIITSPQGVITLQDIAGIYRHFKDVRQHARVEGEQSIGLAVSKRTGANIIDTVSAVTAIVEQEREYLPPGVQIIFAQDASRDITNMLRDLENNIVLAILLVMGIMSLIMGGKSAVLVGLSIPGSFLLGILALSGVVTLNIVVLFSLIMAVGMLVDAAIVVVEYADTLMQQGTPRRDAFAEASRRMAWPIISSTLTTLTVFLPLLFWPGVVGQFMQYMPMTLLATLTASLLMALVFIPVIGAIWRERKPRMSANVISQYPSEHPSKHLREHKIPSGAQAMNRLSERYMRSLIWVLKRPARFLMGITGCVVLLIISFSIFGKGVEFFPAIEPNNANILIKARGNLSIAEMDAKIRAAEEKLAPLQDEIRVLYVRSGVFSSREASVDTIGILAIEFADWQQRRKADVILEDALEKLKGIKGITLETATQKEGPANGKPIQIEISSRAPELLQPYVKKVMEHMQSTGNFRNLESDLPIAKIEWEYRINRKKAGFYGVTAAEVGQVIKLVTNGVRIDTYRPDDADDEVDITVRFPPEYRNLQQLQQLKIYTPQGLVPITHLVDRVAVGADGVLHRSEGVRAYTIQADLAEGVLADTMVQHMQEWFSKNPPDPRLTITFRGENEDQKETGQFLMIAFFIALSLMMLMMLVQFNSFFRAGLIMSAVFFSSGGVLLGLLLTGEPFGVVMCGVGIITLAGIVVNNNIIFIDTYAEYLSAGKDIHTALLETGRDRLRPILLTAGTTVLGLIPMVFSLSIDVIGRSISVGAPSSQWWVQLSTSIAGGLTFATILTLFFTPAALLLWERRKLRLQ